MVMLLNKIGKNLFYFIKSCKPYKKITKRRSVTRQYEVEKMICVDQIKIESNEN